MKLRDHLNLTSEQISRIDYDYTSDGTARKTVYTADLVYVYHAKGRWQIVENRKP